MVGSHYKLACVKCKKEFEASEKGFLLSCDRQHAPAFLRTVYNRKLEIDPTRPGVFRYNKWLPVRRIPETAALPGVFRSERLGAFLGLRRLYVAFNGFWPARGANMETCAFKELEALSVCASISEEERRTLVVSSAGNTGRAFLQVCSTNGMPVIVVVPESALPNMWITVEKQPNAVLAVLKGNVDYTDAIQLGNRIAALDGYFPEGGARNVARRDGMGAVLLRAVEAIGEIPAHYFQAVGSGTGGISNWEMSNRLLEDGSYGDQKMKLHLVQNSPFAIMAAAWQMRLPEVPTLPENEARLRTRQLRANVLSNRNPPYSVRGGVFDALADSGGNMYSVANAEAERAGRLFLELEGCDLATAAEVALAGLIRAVALGRIGRDDLVLLNVTGGGSTMVDRYLKKHYLKPDIVFSVGDANSKSIPDRLTELANSVMR